MRVAAVTSLVAHVLDIYAKGAGDEEEISAARSVCVFNVKTRVTRAAAAGAKRDKRAREGERARERLLRNTAQPCA